MIKKEREKEDKEERRSRWLEIERNRRPYPIHKGLIFAGSRRGDW